MARVLKRIRRRRRTAVLRCCDEHRMGCEVEIDEAMHAAVVGRSLVGLGVQVLNYSE
jgi:hypothetical protein